MDSNYCDLAIAYIALTIRDNWEKGVHDRLDRMRQLVMKKKIRLYMMVDI